MKRITLFLLWICSTTAYGQQDPLEFVEGFFKDLAPCGKPLYCYDYKFEISDTNLTITTKLFNYEGNPKKPVLTEEIIYKIPIDKLERVEYFPYEGQEVYFFMFDFDIEKHKNGELQLIDFIPIDFNKHLLTEELKEEFTTKMKELMDSIK